MLKVALALVCIACASHARRVQGSSEEMQRSSGSKRLASTRGVPDEFGALASLLLEHKTALAFNPSGHSAARARGGNSASTLSRRALLGAATAALIPSAAFAKKSKSVNNEIEIGSQTNQKLKFLQEKLDELTPQAKKAFLQYLPQLQQSGDFLAWEIGEKINDPGRWDFIIKLAEGKNIGSASDPSKLERLFLIPMKILALAFPPDEGGDKLFKALTAFQQAMYGMAKRAEDAGTVGSVTLPTPDSKEIRDVAILYAQARKAWNDYNAVINDATGGYRTLAVIPQNMEEYTRSRALYFQLQKDNALCRARGGETLANLYGYLMVYGTVPGVKPCGYAAEPYFAQN